MRSSRRAALVFSLVAPLIILLGALPVYRLASAHPSYLPLTSPSTSPDSSQTILNAERAVAFQAAEGVPLSNVPAKGLPKLDGILSQLVQAQLEGGGLRVQQVARSTGLLIPDNMLRVVLLADAGAGADLRPLVAAAGGEPESDAGEMLQARVPLSALQTLAQDAAVRHIRLPLTPVAQAIISEGRSRIGIEPWDALVIQGKGVKVGIIDLGFSNFASLAGRELPAQVQAKSFRADEDLTGVGNDHGTAVAEVLHDVAPGAQLYFANFSTEVEMANAADWLAEQGVNIMVSAVGFPGSGPGDGLGAINTVVRTARERGILWVQAAGNFANTHWAGLFTDADGNGFHNFTPGDEGNSLVLPATGGERIYKVEITLTWDDWACWCNDYDLFLLRGDAVVAQSTTWQNGSAPPQERISFVTPTPGEYWIAIQRFRSAKRANLDLFVNVDYRLEYREPRLSLVIPADSPHALTVGAVALDESGVRPYSSQGPTRDGRIKPDLLAPDGVSTETYGALGFRGTSASVPHVAGAAALMKSQRPSLTVVELQMLLESRARRLGNTAKTPVVGFGSLFMGHPLPGALLPFVFKDVVLFPPR